VSSCDTEKVSQLEKENRDLKADLAKKRSGESATADCDLHSKCSRDAKAFFDEGWARTKIRFCWTTHARSNDGQASVNGAPECEV
jgi:hypothetical protein